MENSFKTFLVLASCLLSAVDFNCAQVPTCTFNGQIICASSTHFTTCPVANPAESTRCGVAFPNKAACYGVGPDANSVCYDAPCPQGIGNYPIPHATNAYYICSPNATGAAVYNSSQTCSGGVLYDNTTRACAVVTTTTPLTTTVAITTVATTTVPPTTTAPPPTCAGQQRIVDPNSCNHFYVCGGANSGPGTRTKCPYSMRFDVASNGCRIRYFTYCGTRPDTSV